jgi:hypothetical protein
MNLFSRKETAMIEPETTGADVLRAVIRARRHKSQFGLLARDMHIAVSDL